MTDIILGSSGTIEDIEKQAIQIRINMFRGNKSQCAISLGISIRTLDAKLEKYADDKRKTEEREAQEAIERSEILDRQRGIIPQSRSEEGGPRVYGSTSGVHVQPSIEAPPQHAMPVSQQQKVQSVLPKQASAGHQGRRR